MDIDTVGEFSKHQPEGQIKMELKPDLSLNKTAFAGNPVNPLGLSIEEMEAELASIEAQRQSVTLARRLAAAKEEQTQEFPVPGTTPMVAPRGPRKLAISAAQSAKNSPAYVPGNERLSNTGEEQNSRSTQNNSRVDKLNQHDSETSLDSLIGRISALEDQMPQAEQSQIHNLLIEQQKIAVGLKAIELNYKRRVAHTRSTDGGWRSGVQRRSGWNGPTNNDRLGDTAFKISKGGLATGGNTISTRHERHGKKKDLSQIICYKCEKPGHYASKCLEPMKRETIVAPSPDYGSSRW